MFTWYQRSVSNAATELVFHLVLMISRLMQLSSKYSCHDTQITRAKRILSKHPVERGWKYESVFENFRSLPCDTFVRFWPLHGRGVVHPAKKNTDRVHLYQSHKRNGTPCAAITEPTVKLQQGAISEHDNVDTSAEPQVSGEGLGLLTPENSTKPLVDFSWVLLGSRSIGIPLPQNAGSVPAVPLSRIKTASLHQGNQVQLIHLSLHGERPRSSAIPAFCLFEWHSGVCTFK